MEMHQVRYFLATARVLNFTRAAEECHVAQPSLTRAIKQLEQEFGGELFRRERNLTHLSELGHRMLPLMQQCYESAASAKALAASIKSGSVTPLSVVLATSVNISLFIPFLTELLRVFPGTELRFLRGTSAEVTEHLKNGDADVAIAGPLESWARLETWPLFTEPYRLAVGKHHPLSKCANVGIDQIRKEPFLTRTYCEHLNAVSNFLKDVQGNDAPSHKVVSEHDLEVLLESNLGVSIAPLSATQSATVGFVSIVGLDLCRTVHVYAVAGRQRSTVTSTLVNMLRAADWSSFDTTGTTASKAMNCRTSA